MPVTHVVLITWADHTDGPARHAVRQAIRSLQHRVPGVDDLREGESISPEGLESGFEYGFVITFPDAAARDAYLPPPEHLAVAEEIGRSAAKVLVFDI
jgi:hypothetical protein